MNREQILGIVIDSVKDLVDTFTEDQKFEVSEETRLFGSGSQIDSLSLVTMIVDLEMKFAEEFNYDLSLTDDRAMAREVSPFSSISSLTDYISELNSEKK
jgi:acyl carrier protein